MKTCKKCHEKLVESSFRKNRAHNDGLANECKQCARAIQLVRRGRNKETNAVHDCANCEGIAVTCTTCAIEYQQSEMPVARNEKTAHSIYCFKCARIRSNASRQRTIFKRTLTVYKLMAKKWGREWTLTDSEASKLFLTDCAYCGKPPNPINGIDRFNNTKGYTLDNSIACCLICNRGKNNMSSKDWRSHLAGLVKHALAHPELYPIE